MKKKTLIVLAVLAALIVIAVIANPDSAKDGFNQGLRDN